MSERTPVVSKLGKCQERDRQQVCRQARAMQILISALGNTHSGAGIKMEMDLEVELTSVG